MAPKLVVEGKIQILGETLHSVVYAVATDSTTGLAKDSQSVLKGGTVWYEGRKAVGPGKNEEVSVQKAIKEAAIYNTLGKHDRILGFLGLQTATFGSSTEEPTPWAIRLERALCSLRHCILEATNLPPEQSRLQLAFQFAEGVVHIHQCGIIWGDLSTRNALLFDKWHIKLCDFAESDWIDKYRTDWYGCESRYCPPGSDWPQYHNTDTMKREISALGTAIYEIVEWKVPYGSPTEISEEGVIQALVEGKWPKITSGNPAKDVIRNCWASLYKSSTEVVTDLKALLK